MPERIDLLEKRIERLERELQEFRAALKPPGFEQVRESPPAAAPSSGATDDTSEELLAWVGKSSLLPRISTLCFLLVVALILRTVTDNGLIDKQVGSLLGMTYAALLISIGWHKYSRSSRLAPVFAVCGTILMFSIVVETHAHFASLPSVPAYVLLVATGLGMGLISYFHQSALPVLVGSLGMALAALAVDYPHPYYPHLAAVLLVANVLGAFATRLQTGSWLRWTLLILTLVMLQVWGIKAGMRLLKGAEEAAAIGAGWYLPTIGLFVLMYLGTAIWAVLRGAERITRFDWCLPAVSSAWAVGASLHFVHIRWGMDVWLGWLGVALAVFHLIFAAWLARKHLGGVPGTNSFFLAGLVTAALSLPSALGSQVASLPVFSFLALGLCMASRKWENGGLRTLSYLAQIYAGAVLGAEFWESAESFGVAVVAATFMTGLSLAHYQWCRWYPPSVELSIFSRFDPEDRTAVLLFLSGLANAFFLVRRMLYEVLSERGGDIVAAFHGGQSVAINLAAAALILTAFRRRNEEIRNVAGLVTLIGAGKVFIFDIFTFRGLPLVLAVFSFGLTVSLLSVCLTRWHKGEGWEEGRTGGADQPRAEGEKKVRADDCGRSA